MHAVTGIFRNQTDASDAAEALRASGVGADRITLLTPGNVRAEDAPKAVPIDAAEQPGMGKAMGAVVGAVGGFSGGTLLAAIVPGVGAVTAAGLLGAAILGAAGAGIGAVAGESLEDRMSRGIPEDEIFVYEDALRQGRSVVLAMAKDSKEAEALREQLASQGAEAVDAARQQWWIGLRSAEREHYAAAGRDFGADEEFYRSGFELALDTRMRCLTSGEAATVLSDNLKKTQAENPGRDVGDPYREGFRRGREYYRRMCDDAKAA